jgi:tRNA (cytidine/uridine-2'-O-)-methyltransferase
LQFVQLPYEAAMRLALFQPEIPGNVGAMLRLSACFAVAVDVIEPCGFVFSDARLKRAGMDYIDHVSLTRHADWEQFATNRSGRLVLLTTKADSSLYDFTFAAGDILLMGQESAGVPADVAEQCDARIKIPMNPAIRSLNVSVAAGIALAEALRQTGQLPK